MWFRVGRTVRKYQARTRTKNKIWNNKICNKLKSIWQSSNGASEIVNRILTRRIFLFVHFTCSLANRTTNYLYLYIYIYWYVRPQIREQLTVKEYISTHLSTISSAVQLFVCVLLYTHRCPFRTLLFLVVVVVVVRLFASFLLSWVVCVRLPHRIA